MARASPFKIRYKKSMIAGFLRKIHDRENLTLNLNLNLKWNLTLTLLTLTLSLNHNLN
jgi:hypothetical protein